MTNPPTDDDRRPSLRAWGVAGYAAATGAATALVATSPAPTEGVPVHDLEALSRWAGTGDPALHVLTLLRGGVLLLGSWTTLLLLTALAAHVCGAGRTAIRLARSTPIPVPSLLRPAGAIAASSFVLLPGPVALATTSTDTPTTTAPPPEATMRFIPSEGEQPAPMPPPAPAAVPVPMAESDTAATTPTTTTPPSADQPTATAPRSPEDAAPVAPEAGPDAVPPIASRAREERGERSRVVIEGECLWSIAADDLRRNGVAAADETVIDHWLDLISANRDRLVDPSNPDLLHVGQVLVLPPLPGAP